MVESSASAASGSPRLDVEKGGSPASTPAPTASAPAPLAFAADDPESPFNWPLRKRAPNVLTLSIATLALTFNSSAFTNSIPGIIQEFGVSRLAAVVGVSIYVLGFAIGPMLFSPMSEIVGRRPVFLVSYLGFSAFSWGVAYAPNFAALLIFRFLAAFCGTTSLSIVPACINDQFGFAGLNWAVPFALSAFAGPSLGPFLGAFIVAGTGRDGWRWNLIVQAIFVTVCWVGIIFLCPETHAPTLLAKRAKRELKAARSDKERQHDRELLDRLEHTGPSFMAKVRVGLTRPFVLLFTEPLLAWLCLYASLLYGILFGFFAAFPYVYETVHGLSATELGLTYLSLWTGFCIGAGILLGPQYKATMAAIKKGQAEGKPALFTVGQYTSLLAPAGLFIFAFTSYSNLPIAGMLVGEVFFSISMLLAFTGMIPYIAFPLFSQQAYQKLTPTGMSALLAGLTLLLAPAPFVILRYGGKFRERSKNMVAPRT